MKKLLVALLLSACASPSTPTTPLPASTIANLNTSGALIGATLKSQSSTAGDVAMAAAVVPILYSLAPTTSTSNAALASTIAAQIPAGTQNVPSAVSAATSIAQAINQANPTSTTAQVAAIATLGNAITQALYLNAQ